MLNRKVTTKKQAKRRQRKANQNGVRTSLSGVYSAQGQPSRLQVAPVSTARQLRSSAPRVVGSYNTCRIVHRELIASIQGTAGFSAGTPLYLNPGLQATFPWLATQAIGWEKYEFNAVRFMYYPRCSTATPGSFMMVPDYDVLDAAPTSERIASTYQDAVADAPWVENVMSLDRKSMNMSTPTHYVRTGPPPGGSDLRLYDSAIVFPCTMDGTVVNWGKLWVEYDVTFSIPQLPAIGVTGLIGYSATGLPTSTQILAFEAQPPESTAIIEIVNETCTFLIGGRFYFNYIANAGTVTEVVGPVFTGGAASVAPASGTWPNGSAVYWAGGSGTANYALSFIIDAPVGGVVTLNNTIIVGADASLHLLPVPANYT